MNHNVHLMKKKSEKRIMNIYNHASEQRESLELNTKIEKEKIESELVRMKNDAKLKLKNDISTLERETADYIRKCHKVLYFIQSSSDDYKYFRTKEDAHKYAKFHSLSSQIIEVLSDDLPDDEILTVRD